jgi:hypothetical protein
MKKRSTNAMMVSHPGNAESVRVTAHERRKPTKNATGPARTAQIVTDDLAENSKMSEMPDRGILSGLRGPGESEVNHLRAAVGLLNRRKA